MDEQGQRTTGISEILIAITRQSNQTVKGEANGARCLDILIVSRACYNGYLGGLTVAQRIQMKQEKDTRSASFACPVRKKKIMNSLQTNISLLPADQVMKTQASDIDLAVDVQPSNFPYLFYISYIHHDQIQPKS